MGLIREPNEALTHEAFCVVTNSTDSLKESNIKKMR
jgi:hypothetical protein